MGCVEGR